MAEMTLRRRNVAVNLEPIEKVKKSIPARLAQVDVFSKPKEDYSRVQTPWGGVVSGVTLLIIILLLVSECFDYILGRSAYRTELSISENNLGHMIMNIDIDFPEIQCHKLRVDLADASGTLRRNITHSLHKIPLNKENAIAFHGQHFYDLFAGNVGYKASDDPDSPDYCGPCVVEGDESKFSYFNQCCNTCESVFSFYESHNIPLPDKSKVHQCLHQISLLNPGCKVKGSLRLKKVRGALIFGPKGSTAMNAYSITDVLEFRSTHRINHLSFGDPHVQRHSNTGYHSLDNTAFSTDLIAEVKYLLNLVPASYISGSRKKKREEPAYEYGAKYRSRLIHIGMPTVPSVSFYFDIFPIKISNVFEREPFSHFLVRLCGIVGGVFVVLGVADDIIHRIEKALR